MRGISNERRAAKLEQREKGKDNKKRKFKQETKISPVIKPPEGRGQVKLLFDQPNH